MNYFTSLLRLVALFFAVLYPFSPRASDTVEQHADLMMHGESYPNICRPDEKKALHQILLTKKVKNVDVAWGAISTILCAPNNSENRLYIKGFLAKSVKRSSDSAGDAKTAQKVARSDELVDEIMAKGNAWNVALRAEPDKINLQYFESEACVLDVTLSFAKRKWTIEEIGHACD